MKYRRFGKTELQMPLLSFGCMRSMHDWTDKPLAKIPEESTAKLEEIARAALANGMYHFETARGYGSSERQLGQVLKRLPRKDIILQTKIAPENDPHLFVRHFHDSLERMEQKYVDLLAIHGINDYQSYWQSCRPGGCLRAARELQRQGKARYIGFSGHGPSEIIQLAINHEGDQGFDYLNLHWYYIYDLNRDAIELAGEKDLGVFIISPTDKGGQLFAPPPLVQNLCSPHHPITFNDLYCLSNPGVHTISVGASKPKDFTEHLLAVELQGKNEPMTYLQETITKLENRMRRTTGEIRPEGKWHELPGWLETPGYINLPFINWLGNLAKGWDLLGFARYRYAMLSGGSSWVPGNNAAHIQEFDFTSLGKKYPAVTPELIDSLQDLHRLLAKENDG